MQSLPLLTAKLFIVCGKFLLIILPVFLGAYCAYRLESKTRAKEEKIKYLDAGNRALYILMDQFNDFNFIYDNHLKSEEHSEYRWLTISHLVSFKNHLRIDFDSIQFMLNRKKPLVVDILLRSDTVFSQLISTINMRFDVHVNQLQPHLENIGLLADKGTVDLVPIVNQLSPRLKLTMIALTNDVYSCCNRGMGLNIEAFDELRSALLEDYPDGDVMDRAPIANLKRNS